jgi:exodeoxyribonuclease V alpha subunit
MFPAGDLKTPPPTNGGGNRLLAQPNMGTGPGPTFAKQIVAAFGKAASKRIKATPKSLRETPGIGEPRADDPFAGWAAQMVVDDVARLHARRVGDARSLHICAAKGHDALHIMTERP